jgi:hypothetical protein
MLVFLEILADIVGSFVRWPWGERYVGRGGTRNTAPLIRTYVVIGFSILGFSLGGAYWANLQNQKIAEDQLMSDRDQLDGKPKTGVFGFVELKGRYERKLTCDEFCLRMLLSGKATSFVVLPQSGLPSWAAQTKATGYRIETRDTCPPPPPSGQGYHDNIVEFKTEIKGARYGRWQKVLLEMQASGQCLVPYDTVLGTADFMIEYQTIDSWNGGESYYLTSDGSATRVRFFEKEKNGANFQQSYQNTAIHKPVFPLFLFPGCSSTRYFRRMMPCGQYFLHHFASLNGGVQYPRGENILALVQGRLGIDLDHVQPPERANIKQSKKVALMLDMPAKDHDATEAMLRDYFAEISQAKLVTDDDAKLILRILADSDIKVPDDARQVVSLFADNHKDLTPKLADDLFAKFDSFAATAKGEEGVFAFLDDAKFKLGDMDGALSALPAQALEGHKGSLIALWANTKIRRWFRLSIMAYVSTLDDQAGFYDKQLSQLVDAGLTSVPDGGFLAHTAFLGLCQTGPLAKPYLPNILKIAIQYGVAQQDFNVIPIAHILGATGYDKAHGKSALNLDQIEFYGGVYDRSYDEGALGKPCQN